MTSRELIEINSGFRSALWTYMRAQVDKKVSELRQVASRMTRPEEALEREQMFGGANYLEDFIGQMPDQIQHQLKIAQARELQNENS